MPEEMPEDPSQPDIDPSLDLPSQEAVPPESLDDSPVEP